MDVVCIYLFTVNAHTHTHEHIFTFVGSFLDKTLDPAS